MSNPNEVPGWEKEFCKLWDLLEPEVCTRVKTHGTQTLDDYQMLEPDDIIEFIKKEKEDSYTQGYKDALEKVKKEMFVNEPDPNPKDFTWIRQYQDQCTLVFAHNHALNHVKDIITNLLNDK